jgi:hypothetical protein
MMNTVWAVVRDGKIELLEQADWPEGARLLVTLVPDDEARYWLTASRVALDAVWNNAEDDLYAELLKG